MDTRTDISVMVHAVDKKRTYIIEARSTWTLTRLLEEIAAVNASIVSVPVSAADIRFVYPVRPETNTDKITIDDFLQTMEDALERRAALCVGVQLRGSVRPLEYAKDA